ncbi:MAG: ATP-binding protein, partial [Planctomycetota bacterium]
GRRDVECTCTPAQVNAYRGRISGPLLDRIDLCLDVPRPTFTELSGDPPGEGSAEIRGRVIEARAVQAGRQGEGRPNAALAGDALRALCRPDDDGTALLRTAVDHLGLSARAHDRVLRVARTIADLEGRESVHGGHVAEALQYRVRGAAVS